MADIGQYFKDKARKTPGWEKMNCWEREATDMVLHKLGRLLAGNPHNIDGWHDIQGYAKLVEDRLTHRNVPVNPTLTRTIMERYSHRGLIERAEKLSLKVTIGDGDNISISGKPGDRPTVWLFKSFDQADSFLTGYETAKRG